MGRGWRNFYSGDGDGCEFFARFITARPYIETGRDPSSTMERKQCRRERFALGGKACPRGGAGNNVKSVDLREGGRVITQWRDGNAAGGFRTEAGKV